MRAAALDVLAFGMAPALMWGGMWVYFDRTQRLAEFLDAVFLFNLSYSDDSVGYFHRFVRFFSPPRVDFIFDSAAPLWYGSIAALGWLALKGVGLLRPSATATGSHGGAPIGSVSLIFAFVIAGYVAICLPGQFWPHYYYLLFPPMILAIGMAVADLARYVVWRERVVGEDVSHARRSLAVLVCAVLPVLLLVTEYQHYLRVPLAEITFRRYNTRDFWGRAQGENLRRVTEPSDCVFVYSNDPSIYYYSGRRCASRYTMITGLSEGYVGAERRREILIQDLERDPPRVILLLFEQDSFDAWVEFIDRYYGEPVGWDLHDNKREPIMLVLARKDQPIEEIDWDWDRSSLRQN